MTAGTMPVPTEAQEQRTLAEWLDVHGLLWTHPANEGSGSRVRGAILRGQGVKAGVPDILVFTPPPYCARARGAAIELKRRRGGRVSPLQREWLARLEAHGWVTAVCRGAGEAIDELTRWGYGRR